MSSQLVVLAIIGFHHWLNKDLLCIVYESGTLPGAKDTKVDEKKADPDPRRVWNVLGDLATNQIITHTDV